MEAASLPVEPQGKPKNTGVGRLSLLQRIFLTQELNWGLLHCRQILYQLSHQPWELTGNSRRGDSSSRASKRKKKKGKREDNLREKNIRREGFLLIICYSVSLHLELSGHKCVSIPHIKCARHCTEHFNDMLILSLHGSSVNWILLGKRKQNHRDFM